MHMGFQLMAISQLAKRFSADSWWAKSYKDFSEDDLVAYYKGDFERFNLCLRILR